jgi:hypothetical protein
VFQIKVIIAAITIRTATITIRTATITIRTAAIAIKTAAIIIRIPIILILIKVIWTKIITIWALTIAISTVTFLVRLTSSWKNPENCILVPEKENRKNINQLRLLLVVFFRLLFIYEWWILYDYVMKFLT